AVVHLAASLFWVIQWISLGPRSTGGPLRRPHQTKVPYRDRSKARPIAGPKARAGTAAAGLRWRSVSSPPGDETCGSTQESPGGDGVAGAAASSPPLGGRLQAQAGHALTNQPAALPKRRAGHEFVVWNLPP